MKLQKAYTIARIFSLEEDQRFFSHSSDFPVTYSARSNPFMSEFLLASSTALWTSSIWRENRFKKRYWVAGNKLRSDFFFVAKLHNHYNALFLYSLVHLNRFSNTYLHKFRKSNWNGIKKKEGNKLQRWVLPSSQIWDQEFQSHNKDLHPKFNIIDSSKKGRKLTG